MNGRGGKGARVLARGTADAPKGGRLEGRPLPFCTLLLALLLAACSAALSPAAAPLAEAGVVAPDDHEWFLRLRTGCNLYVHEMGTGPVVVVLHDGWGMEHSGLVDGFRPLSRRFRFVFYDQRASLRSPCDSLASVQGHVDDLNQLRAALGGEPLHLVGHGMGGYLAMRYAAAHPDGVASLSLLASVSARGAEAQPPGQAQIRERFQRPRSVAEFRRNGIDTEKSPSRSRQRYVEHRIAKGAALLHNVERWRQLKGTLFYSSGASRTAGAPPPAEDLTGALAALPFAIQVLAPDDDYYPVEVATRWVRNVPNAELEIVPQAGHFLWIDQPERFNRLLGRYLGRAVAARGTSGASARTAARGEQQP